MAKRAAFTLAVLIAGAPIMARAENASVSPVPSSMHLILSVVVNGHDRGQVVEADKDPQGLTIDKADLLAIGVDPGPEFPDGPVRLSLVPRLSWSLDEATQRLSLSYTRAPGDIERLTLAGGRTAQLPPVTRSSGLVLNYDLSLSGGNGGTVGGGLFEARAFSAAGSFSSSVIATTSGGATNGAGHGVIRLDTRFTRDDPDRLLTMTAGDLVSGGVAWSRPVRLGGIQIGTDFTLRPDLVTFPLPRLGGSVAVPSTIDILVDGVRRPAGQAEPGDFVVGGLPVFSGNGTIGLAVRDALGRETIQTFDFYSAPDLLASGLTAFSAELGAVRRGYGLSSFDYGPLAGSASYRRGLSDVLTIEGHAEATSKLGMVGGGGAMRIGSLGTIRLSAAGSIARDPMGGHVSGWLGEAGFEHLGKIGLTASYTRASDGFRDIASIAGDGPLRERLQAGAGLSLGRLGAVSFIYARVRTGAVLNDDGGVLTGGGPGDTSQQRFAAVRTSFASASYSLSLGRGISLFGSYARDFSGGGNSGSLTFSIPFGGRSFATAGATFDRDKIGAAAQVSRTAPDPGDFGYRLAGAIDGTRELQAVGLYHGRAAQADVAVTYSAGGTAWRGGVRGAVVVADGGVFLSDTVFDSLAVVDANGVAGVDVLQDNRFVGKTRSDGRLLVPGLRGYDANRIAIDPLTLPADVTVTDPAHEIRPPRQGGAVVAFALKHERSVRVQLVDGAGVALPVGSSAMLAGSSEIIPIGYEGEAYLAGATGLVVMTVTMPGGSNCTARFTVPRTNDGSVIKGIACATGVRP